MVTNERGPGARRRQGIPVRGWKFRFDSPPPGGTSGCSEDGDILSLFLAWDGGRRVDRREGERYVPAETRAYLGWWKGPQFLVTTAELINLSPGGALLSTDARPPTSQPVWVCLGVPQPLYQVQARVLEVTAATAGRRQVRLAFHTPCPPEFFAAAGRRDAPSRPTPRVDLPG